MAKTYTTATQNLLAGASLVERILFVVRLPEGNYGYWNDVYNTTFAAFSGITVRAQALCCRLAKLSRRSR
jgi:hypothetical protein